MRRRHDDVMRELHAAYGNVMAARRDAQRERVRRRPPPSPRLGFRAARLKSALAASRRQVSALRSADEADREEKLRQRREEEPEMKQEVEQQRCHPTRLLMSRNQKLINDTGEDVRRVRRLQVTPTPPF